MQHWTMVTAQANTACSGKKTSLAFTGMTPIGNLSWYCSYTVKVSRKFRGTQYFVSIVKMTAKFVDTFTDQAAVGYVYGDSTCGQRALYPLGMTGIPVYNVNNNCATGSSALFLAKQLVAGGIADCVMALGFEKMQKGK